MENPQQKLHRNLARDLRRNMTEPEKLLWAARRKRQIDGYRFRRQVPLVRYIADFACLEMRLVIELDGQHHQAQQEYDQARDDWMQQQQFKVLRFRNNDLLKNPDHVLQQIRRHLQQQAEYLNT